MLINDQECKSLKWKKYINCKQHFKTAKIFFQQIQTIFLTAATLHSGAPNIWQQAQKVLEILITQRKSWKDHLLIAQISTFGHLQTTEDNCAVSINFCHGAETQLVEHPSKVPVR